MADTFDPDKYLSEKSGQAGASGSFDPDQYLKEKSGDGESLSDLALGALSKIGKKIDSYTGAPTRAAIGAMQTGGHPVDAFENQFGKDPAAAPTGHDIAKRLGISDEPGKVTTAQEQYEAEKKYDPEMAETRKGLPQTDPRAYRDVSPPSPASVAGVAIDLGADPTNLIPLAGEARGLLKGSEAAADVAKVASKPGILESAGNKLKSFAEDSAVNATGATGKQASEFAPGAGRELLDRGLVRFGDSQKKIAERVSQAAAEANEKIDSSLKKLQDAGVTVDRNTIYNTVRSTIDEMKADESKADVARLLESHLDNVVTAADKGGANVGIAKAEEIKRGYNRAAGNWADPDKGMAGKEMYQTWRGAVEDAARKADPTTAATFEEGKKTYGLLAPIQEAAERRAMTTNQHQAGGFLDMAGAVAGESAGGPVMAVAAPVARRLVSPRIGSSVAVVADKAGNALKAAPELSSLVKPGAEGASVSKIADSDISSISKAADSQPAPTKGPGKWQADGLKNLQDHAKSDGDRAAIESAREKLMSTDAGRKLLISASDLKPGSKAMQNVLDKVKEKFGGSQ